jgi:uracil-DNA glycosylase
MPSFPPATDFMPDDATLADLARAVDGCRACPLYENATQGVFGEGPRRARVMMIGEQPGDEEDKAGHPFVGPSGGVLDEALVEVGIPRDEVWVTNAVKHFKWEPRGKRRLHKKPTLTEVRACRPWLEEEIRRVEPEALVCLGATAAQSLFGSKFRLTRQRGEPVDTDWAPWAIATYHPSAILRMPRRDLRREAREAFLADLAGVARRLGLG